MKVIIPNQKGEQKGAIRANKIRANKIRADK